MVAGTWASTLGALTLGRVVAFMSFQIISVFVRLL